MILLLSVFLNTDDVFSQDSSLPIDSKQKIMGIINQGIILKFLPLDDVQDRSVGGILNLSGKSIDGPSGGTLVEIVDYARGTKGDDVIYKIVNNRTNEIKMDRSGPPRFYQVVVVEGKDKGKQGWVGAGAVKIKKNNLAELTPSEKFDQDVLKEIQNLIKDNPGKTDLELQKAAERIRSKEGDSPKWVAVEHYFFALHYTSFLSLDQSPTGMTAVIPAIGGMALGLGWEAWQLSVGNFLGAAAEYIMRDPVSRWPGPRGDFQTNILRWGTLGTMGWRP